MKNQALFSLKDKRFSLKDKSKKLKCRLLQFWFGVLRVNIPCIRLELKYLILCFPRMPAL